MPQTDFVGGVIEGFYGRPWSNDQRRELFRWMEASGLNYFLYAPKDDLKHRARWRELYDVKELAALREIVADAKAAGIRFGYAIAPGLDITHASVADTAALHAKLDQIIALGCRDFSILFDDIPNELSPADLNRFGSQAVAQAHVANVLWDYLRAQIPDATLSFCPTAYCTRRAVVSPRDSVYLNELGQHLRREINIFWTGPEIVSETISVESIEELAAVLRRPPLIWDNLHANDYDMRRLNLGPYAGRSIELRSHLCGILTNPNCEFAANFMAVTTLGAYLNAGPEWSPVIARDETLKAWLPKFTIRGHPAFSFAELELLSDLFYLPHQLGRRAQELGDDFAALVKGWHPLDEKVLTRFEQTCHHIHQLFTRLTELDDRELLLAVYRYLWELNEELQLMRNYVNWIKTAPPRGAVYYSPENLAGTYRGGLVSTLQRVLDMDAQGGFLPRQGR